MTKKDLKAGADDIFMKNMNALAARDPLLVSEILKIKPNTRFEVFVNSDIADYNIYDKELQISIFSTSPLQESMDKFNNFKSNLLIPYLYFYGLGNGVFYKLLLGNEATKRIIIVEPNIELIFIALNFIDFSEEIYSSKLIILASMFCTPYLIGSMFGNRAISVYSKLYNLDIFNSYYDNFKSDIVEINKKMISAIEHAVISVGNDTKDSIIGIQHHISNLKQALNTPTLLEFVTKMKLRSSKSSTAIIVSTGPSLYKQLPLLKKIAPYVTIFSIDASFPILYKHGIKPDIVVSMERVKESAKFYIDTPVDAQKDVIFCISSICHQDLLDAIKLGTKQISFRPFGYTNYFDLHKYGYVGIGMSAANMAYELVVHSRFSRCVFIGQDLAFGEDGSSHCKTAVYGANEVKPKDDEKYFVTKYGGDGEVETTLVWKLFLNFFEKDIQETPYKIEVINSTEGGARISGTREIAFKTICDEILKTSTTKEPLTLANPSKEEIKENLSLAKSKAKELISYGQKQKKKIEKLFLSLTKELEKLEELNAKNNLEKINFKKLDKLSDEIDEIKKLFNDPMFCDCFIDAIQSYIFHQELEIAKITTKYAEDDMAKKAKQIDYLYAHKYWLFSLAGGMDCVINVAKSALKSSKL